MGLALVVVCIVVWGFGVWCGMRWGSRRGLEKLGAAELSNRRRMTGL